jgi:hypothetical protein
MDREVDHPNTGICTDPGDFVFEPVQLAVHRFGMLMRAKVSAALAKIADGQEEGRDRHRMISCVMSNMRLALFALPALFAVRP